MATVVFAPAGGIPFAPGSMVEFNFGIKWLISWMVEKGYRLPEELSPSVVAQFVEDLPGMLQEENEEDSLGRGQVLRGLALLSHLWKQRDMLSKMGIKPIPRDPFFPESMNAIAKRIATKTIGWIKPLPDEVAIPLFNRSLWLLGAPADDVIRLLDVVWDPKAKEQRWFRFNNFSPRRVLRLPAQGNAARRQRARDFLAEFTFTTLEGESSPWHPPLDAAREGVETFHHYIRIRQLLEAVRNACVITLQGSTGMRISEILGIKAGIDPSTNLPVGVRVEESMSGLYECFLIRTKLTKTEKTPRDVDWILGMRPKGSDEMPPAVKALVLLNRIYAPWQEHASTDSLFLSWFTTYGLPLRSASLELISSAGLLGSLKRFISSWVDLSELPNESAHKTEANDLVPWRESKGGIFSTHMLRKTWAKYTLAVDPRLLPAIQMQFHHLSLAMTDGGYIGNNPLLVEALDSVSRQERNLLIYEAVTGEKLLAGRMGEQLTVATRELRDRIHGLPPTAAWETVVSYCEENDLRIFFSPHGMCCPTRTNEMRCHEASTSSAWIRNEPNYSTREPSLCAGCACFVLDVRHRKFWEDRYIQNLVSYKHAVARGDGSQFKVVAERAEQAGKLLRRMGLNTVDLDQLVEMELRSGHAAR